MFLANRDGTGRGDLKNSGRRRPGGTVFFSVQAQSHAGLIKRIEDTYTVER
jgi:hypothetical protein